MTEKSHLVNRATLRHLIKAHRGPGGLDRHARAYAMPRADAVRLGVHRLVGKSGDALDDPVVLCSIAASPNDGDPGAAALLSVRAQAIFHARAYLALETHYSDDEAASARLRARINEIGQVEFDEIRDALREDHALLAPGDDRVIYAEFAATYLELARFAPQLLHTTFPSLRNRARVLAIIRADIDERDLLENASEDGPVSASPQLTRPKLSVGYDTLVARERLRRTERRALIDDEATSWLRRSKGKADRGDDAGALLDAGVAVLAESESLRSAAEHLIADCGRRLEVRVHAAAGATNVALRFLLGTLARVAGSAGRYGPEGRVLLALQHAAYVHETTERVVDVAGALASLGRKKIVRELPAVHAIRSYQALSKARTLAPKTRMEFAHRALLFELLDGLLSDSQAKLRNEMRPRLAAVLERAGVCASDAPERAARDKVLEELLDELERRGFLSFGAVRDTISRNALKFPDLKGPRGIFSADPLLALDRGLAVALDGAYRTSDGYLRWLHLASRATFATWFGRALLLRALVPFGGAFILLEAYAHLLLPHLPSAAARAFDPMSRTSLGVTAALVFGMLHSPGLRSAGRQALGLVGWLLGFAFVTLPKWLVDRTRLRRWLARPESRLVLRAVVLPVFATALVARIVLRRVPPTPGVVAGLGAFFALLVATLYSRLGERVDETVFEHLLPSGTHLSRRLVEGLAGVITNVFEALLDGIDAAFYRVEETLRARGAESAAMLAWKGIVGLLLACVAYVVRLYVTVLIEPELNPIKHVPVVTVAHKLTLPIMPEVLAHLHEFARPLGTVVGGTFAAVTAFFAPSAFGFLAWELKENYRLYKGSRGIGLPRTVIGKHGETMRGLLVPGFHSGALPKVFRRLRRVAEREHHETLRRALSGNDSGSAVALRSLRALRSEVRAIEQRVERVVRREVCALLAGATRWAHGAVVVKSVELSPSRVRVSLECLELGSTPCAISFEAQSGNVIATLEPRGFVDELLARGGDSVTVFENALFGLYHLSEVDFVRQQIEANIPDCRRYDFDDRGVVVWPTEAFDVQLRFAVGQDHATVVEPELVGVGGGEPGWVLDLRKVVFSRSMVGWVAWVAAWASAEHPTARIPRLTQGSSLLHAGELTS